MRFDDDDNLLPGVEKSHFSDERNFNHPFVRNIQRNAIFVAPVPLLFGKRFFFTKRRKPGGNDTVFRAARLNPIKLGAGAVDIVKTKLDLGFGYCLPVALPVFGLASDL